MPSMTPDAFRLFVWPADHGHPAIAAMLGRPLWRAASRIDDICK
jgi:hypothetical protein